jgi:hypothetical protein
VDRHLTFLVSFWDTKRQKCELQICKSLVPKKRGESLHICTFASRINGNLGHSNTTYATIVTSRYLSLCVSCGLNASRLWSHTYDVTPPQATTKINRVAERWRNDGRNGQMAGMAVAGMADGLAEWLSNGRMAGMALEWRNGLIAGMPEWRNGCRMARMATYLLFYMVHADVYVSLPSLKQ